MERMLGNEIEGGGKDLKRKKKAEREKRKSTM
jgi:hypothetical protein